VRGQKTFAVRQQTWDHLGLAPVSHHNKQRAKPATEAEPGPVHVLSRLQEEEEEEEEVGSGSALHALDILQQGVRSGVPMM